MSPRELKHVAARVRSWLLDEGSVLRMETRSDIALLIGALVKRVEAEIKEEEEKRNKEET